MNAVQELWKQVEIRFWHQVAIPLLDSESETIKNIVNVGYQSVKRYQPMNTLLKAFVWILMGLSFGLTIGLMVY